MLQKFLNIWSAFVVRHICCQNPYDAEREIALQNQRKADKINSDITRIKTYIDKAKFYDQFSILMEDINVFRQDYNEIENIESIVEDLENYLSDQIEFVQKVWVIE